MGLLDDLRKEADALQSRETKRTEELREIAASVDAAMRTTFRFLNELFKHLNVVKPPCLLEYELTNVGKLHGLRQSDYRVEYRTQERFDAEHYESLEVIFKRTKAEKFTVRREGPAIERFRDFLWQQNMRFTSEVFRNDRRVVLAEVFSIDCEVLCGVEVIGDYEKGNLRFTLKNIEGFGHSTIAIDPKSIHDQSLDELAKLMVGSESKFSAYRQRGEFPPITGRHQKVALLEPQYVVSDAPELSDEELAAQEKKRAGLLGSLKSVFKKP